MWVFVFFDLPTETKIERRAAQLFRKKLIQDGFEMFQFSIYLRCCPSRENGQVHMKRIKKALPEYGKIGMLEVTDIQFGRMELFHGKKQTDLPTTTQQLELF